MLGVVPAEEGLAEEPAVFETTEPLWKIRPIFQRFKMGLRIGVVIAHIGPGKAFCDPQISKKEGNRF